jgi:hypothetical protein
MFFCLLVLFFGKTAMAQMGYEYFLVATYEIPESGKSWMCRDGALIQEKVADKASFDKRCKEILQLYAGNSSFSSNVRLVNPNQAILAYEYQKKEAGWGCTKKVISVNVGKDLNILNMK